MLQTYKGFIQKM